jgi:hypothetical protein
MDKLKAVIISAMVNSIVTDAAGDMWAWMLERVNGKRKIS